MSGEWTVGTLHEHFDRVLEERDGRYRAEFAAQRRAVDAALAAQEKATDAAFAAAEKAVAKAEGAQDERLATHNGLQEQLKAQSAQTYTRKEVDLLLAPVAERLSALENWRSKAMGAAVVMVMLAGSLGGAVVKAFGG